MNREQLPGSLLVPCLKVSHLLVLLWLSITYTKKFLSDMIKLIYQQLGMQIAPLNIFLLPWSSTSGQSSKLPEYSNGTFLTLDNQPMFLPWVREIDQVAQGPTELCFLWLGVLCFCNRWIFHVLTCYTFLRPILFPSLVHWHKTAIRGHLKLLHSFTFI